METDKIFPDNWKEVIQEKKVIFYNTSIGSLLSGREKHIEKMKWVFDIFQKHPEVVLWWRPHPLELSTVESMVPQLTEQYIDMRKQYQESQIGILDESTDLHRAIAISDAYYGDWSSVVQLYKAVKKPVLFKNIAILKEELFYQVSDFVSADNKVWFVSAIMNILFAMNPNTFELVEMIKIPYGNMLKKYVSYGIANVQNYIVLIPGCGKWIIRFDLNERKFEQIEIGIDTACVKFGAYTIYKDYLYMLPAFDNRIIKYDVIHHKIICVKELRKEKDTLFLETNIDVSESYIYAVESNRNFIYKYDMQKETYEKIQVPGEDIHLSGIKKVKNFFILTLVYRNEILLWDEQTNRVWSLEGLPKEYPAKYRLFGDFVEYNEDIYFFPEQADRVFKLNTDQMVLEQYLGIEEKGGTGDETYFTRAKNVGDQILAFDCLHNQWVVANPDKDIVKKHSISMQDKMLDEIAGYSIFDRDEASDEYAEVWEEDRGFYALHHYIKDVARRSTIGQNVEPKKSIGKMIYEAVTADFVTG